MEGRHLFSLGMLLAALCLAPGCGTGAGSGTPCTRSAGCPAGENCILVSCNASTATCEALCEEDDDCTGGFDTSPSGAACVSPDVAACPARHTPDQGLSAGYCVE
ncbi:MAG: hypothetical protein ACQEXJ_11045 [Myxococcota bacterium]